MDAMIQKLTALIAQPSEAELPLVEALCAAALRETAGRLRPGLTAEACGESFCCAAALLAAAGLLACRESGTIESFTAGDVSVKSGGGGETAASLRRQAALMMAPYWRDDDFAFMGVRG